MYLGRILKNLFKMFLTPLSVLLLAFAPTAYAQVSSFDTPTEWIEKKASELGRSLKTGPAKSVERSDSRTEKKYRLKLSDKAQETSIKNEIHTLYGEPSKVTSEALIWYVPNPGFSPDRAAMTIVKLKTDKKGNGVVVVKQMSRKKRAKANR